MKNTFLTAVCLALAPLSARADAPKGDAPKSETPQAVSNSRTASAQETASQNQAGAPSSPAAPVSPEELKKYYSKTVNEYVDDQARKAGSFVVHDDVLGKDWKLKMLKVHTDRIWDRGDGHFFACADLRETAGGKKKVDLDFYVHRDGQRWVMDKVIVHKVSGKARYTYIEDGGKWYMEDAATKRRALAE